MSLGVEQAELNALAVGLLGFRRVHSGDHAYLFLVWNLFLAWVPYGLGTLMGGRCSPRASVSTSGDVCGGTAAMSVQAPWQLAADAVEHIARPGARPGAWGPTLVFGALLGLGYLVFLTITRLPRPSAEAPRG